MAKDIDAKIDELAAMVANGFSDAHSEMREVRSEMQEMRAEMQEMRSDMATKADLERFIGVVRSDYDDLAERVKDLEKIVLP